LQDHRIGARQFGLLGGDIGSLPTAGIGVRRFHDEGQPSGIGPVRKIGFVEDGLPTHAVEVRLHDFMPLGGERFDADIDELARYRGRFGMGNRR
jgi:hypothetical protein